MQSTQKTAIAIMIVFAVGGLITNPVYAAETLTDQQVQKVIADYMKGLPMIGGIYIVIKNIVSTLENSGLGAIN